MRRALGDRVALYLLGHVAIRLRGASPLLIAETALWAACDVAPILAAPSASNTLALPAGSVAVCK